MVEIIIYNFLFNIDGSILTRFGANVIKLDTPNPIYSPHITVIYGVVTNIGKESILLDITQDKGRKVLEEIIKKMDVIIVNSTTLERPILAPATQKVYFASHPHTLLFSC